MYISAYRPLDMKNGIIVPIPKCKNNNGIMENYRGLTLMNTLSKVYDKILLNRYEEWFKSNLNKMQAISNSGSSCLHTSLLCREVISQNKTTYFAFLDVKKAFDSVWINGLLFKLINLKMDKLLWLIIKNSFDKFKCRVRINGALSQPFYPLQGVHQGDIFSMYLYCIYINDVLNELNTFPMSVKLNKDNCTAPSYVDDVTLLASSQASLQNLIDVAVRHSVKWKYEYNVKKCKILIIGEHKDKLNIYMCGKVLEITLRYKHVGVPLYLKPKEEKSAIAERVSELNTTTSIIKNIGARTGGTSPISASKLYWSVAVPKLIYGCELWEVSPENLNVIEKAHDRAARMLQFLPDHCPGDAARNMLGWFDLEHFIDMRRLMFLYSLIANSKNILVHRTIINVLIMLMFSAKTYFWPNFSPVNIIFNTCKKYTLCNKVFELLLNPKIISKKQWKSYVFNKIRMKYELKIKVACIMYKSLHIYNKCFNNNISVLWTWKISKSKPECFKQCKVVTKIIIGGDPFYKNIMNCYRSKNTLCQFCNTYSVISIKHVIFECDKFQLVRSKYLDYLITAMPEGMRKCFKNMTYENKLVFLLSGFNVKFTREWGDIYLASVHFIYFIHQQFVNSCKNVHDG